MRALVLLLTLAGATPLADEGVDAACVSVRGGVPPGVSVTLAHCIPDLPTWEEIYETLEQILGPERLA